MDTTPRMSAAEYRQLQNPGHAQPNTEQAYRKRHQRACAPQGKADGDVRTK